MEIQFNGVRKNVKWNELKRNNNDNYIQTHSHNAPPERIPEEEKKNKREICYMLAHASWSHIRQLSSDFISSSFNSRLFSSIRVEVLS